MNEEADVPWEPRDWEDEELSFVDTITTQCPVCDETIKHTIGTERVLDYSKMHQAWLTWHIMRNHEQELLSLEAHSE